MHQHARTGVRLVATLALTALMSMPAFVRAAQQQTVALPTGVTAPAPVPPQVPSSTTKLSTAPVGTGSPALTGTTGTPSASNAATDPTLPTTQDAVVPVVDTGDDPVAALMARLKREHPSVYFRQEEALVTDDTVTQLYVQKLLDQYDAALGDRTQLQAHAARAVSGYVQAGTKVELLEDHLATLAADILASEISSQQLEQQRRAVDRQVLDRRLRVSKLTSQVHAQEEVVRFYIRALQGSMEKSGFEILLSSPSFAHAVDSASQLDTVKDAGAKSIERLSSLRASLRDEQEELTRSERDLADVVQSITEQQAYLQDQRREKEMLLVRTRGQQLLYEQLMGDAQSKQAEVERELQEIVDALSTLAEPAALQRLGLPGQTDESTQVSAAGFIWPVPPLKITTFFRDPEYRKLFPFEHDGIDIRAAQGTEVKLAADGVVYAAKDRGKGYSFVVVLHRNHRTTVYGHLSRIDVKEGQTIRQGTVIGLSGGAVGSEGSGRYTTGPHLHFEMRESGRAINPLDLLP